MIDPVFNPDKPEKPRRVQGKTADRPEHKCSWQLLLIRCVVRCHVRKPSKPKLRSQGSITPSLVGGIFCITAPAIDIDFGMLKGQDRRTPRSGSQREGTCTIDRQAGDRPSTHARHMHLRSEAEDLHCNVSGALLPVHAVVLGRPRSCAVRYSILTP